MERLQSCDPVENGGDHSCGSLPMLGRHIHWQAFRAGPGLNPPISQPWHWGPHCPSLPSPPCHGLRDMHTFILATLGCHDLLSQGQWSTEAIETPPHDTDFQKFPEFNCFFPVVQATIISHLDGYHGLLRGDPCPCNLFSKEQPDQSHYSFTLFCCNPTAASLSPLS